jgi:hypothetical protein
MADVQYGQRDTLGVSDKTLYINIEDQVTKYPSLRRELIKRLDSKVFKDEVKSYKYEWSARPNRPLSTTVAVDAPNNATSMIVSDPGVFNVDDVFQGSNGAQFRVTSVSGGVNVTFEKIAGTQAAMPLGTKVSIVNGGTPHGKDADSMVTTGFDDYFNYTSNFEDVIELSDLQHNAMVRGELSQAELVAIKHMELTEKLQRAIVLGIRGKDSVNKVTYMGGLKNIIDLYAPAANKINFGGSAVWSSSTVDRDVQDKIDSALDVVAAKAFKAPVLWVTPAFMKKFKHIQTDKAYTTVDSSEKRGIGVVRKYDSHVFGLIDVVQLQGMDGIMDDLVFITDESDIGYKAHRGLEWQTYPLARTGQSYKWQVSGHYTFKVGIPEAHCYLYNLGLT